MSSYPLYTVVLTISTGPPDKDEENFVWTSKFLSFYLDICKNKFKNLIWTGKFKFSFQGLLQVQIICISDLFL